MFEYLTFLRKKNTYIIIAIILFLIYAIYYSVKSDQLINDSRTYTIGSVEKITAAGNGLRVYITFFYKNVKHRMDYIEGSDRAKKLASIRRLFIKIAPADIDRVFDFKVDCIVPDSIQTAPYEGWDEEWMKNHFPNCLIK